ncbi:MAG: DNA recombination protein RmuC [Microbacteriaceae bacterium]
MDATTSLILGLAIGLVIGLLGGWLVFKATSKLPAQLSAAELLRVETEAKLRELESDIAQTLGELSELEGSFLQVQERMIEAEKNASAGNAKSSALSEQIVQLLDQQKAHQAKEQQQNVVLQALSPVQETLRTMQQKVTELETQRAQQYGEITSQLEQTRETGERIRSTADSLASALKSNSTRGVWGEVQLKNIVEASGMVEHVDFNTQVSGTSEQGESIRPDMVINLPGGKTIAVDSKVPFNKYLEAHEIPDTAPQSELDRRASLMKEHAKALKNHIDTLAKKEYWSGQEHSPEFTVAFIPSESLIAAALEADIGLMDYAFRKKVALSSPVTLWSVLKTVAYTWSQDTITREAKQLLDLGKQLYERLNVMAGHVNKLKRSIDGTVTSFNSFAGSLEGRVYVSARSLSWLDESTVLPQIEQITADTRPLGARELTENDDSVELLELDLLDVSVTEETTAGEIAGEITDGEETDGEETAL